MGDDLFARLERYTPEPSARFLDRVRRRRRARRARAAGSVVGVCVIVLVGVFAWPAASPRPIHHDTLAQPASLAALNASNRDAGRLVLPEPAPRGDAPIYRAGTRLTIDELDAMLTRL